MDRVAGWIDAVVAAEAAGDEAAVEKVGAEVREFAAGFPMPGCRPDRTCAEARVTGPPPQCTARTTDAAARRRPAVPVHRADRR